MGSISSNPYVSAAVAEAKTIGQWVVAQVGSVVTQHKLVAAIVFAAGFVAGHIL